MKIILIILISLFSFSIFSQETGGSSGGGKFGLGLTLFGPTGITGKYKLDDKKAIEGSLGFGSFGNGRFHLHGVFLYNFHQFSDAVGLYVGGGLVMQERRYNEGNGKGRGWGNIFKNDDRYETSLGLRVPFGVSWFVNKQFELSAEVHMNLFLTGRDGADLGLALAGRYYF